MAKNIVKSILPQLFCYSENYRLSLQKKIYQGLTNDEVIRSDVENVDLDAGTVYDEGE